MDNEGIEIIEDKSTQSNYKKKSKKVIVLVIILILLIACGGITYYLYSKGIIFNNTNDSGAKETIETNSNILSEYRISNNGLDKFDLYFLQLENSRNNKVYSPLSIKYALAMLQDGANGNSKEQIKTIIGDYVSKKYINSNNMSFANAMFIKDNYKNNVKEDYINTLNNKYSAEIIYDNFNSPTKVNSWVSEKTFKLINNLFENVSDKNLFLVNALAIDMEWINKIQSEHEDWNIHYDHEEYYKRINGLDSTDYYNLKFYDMIKDAKSVEIGASVNKYDIVNEIGEQNIRTTVGKEYQKWLEEDECVTPEDEKDVDKYLDTYIKEINSNYNQISSSTDFYFYDDNDVKVFAKDLKNYNGTTLQYVGIMPKRLNLDHYINDIDVNNINNILKNLKPIVLDSFKDGVITEIKGYIPMFKIDYELNIKDDLKKLGVSDVFDENKADLSNITSDNLYIDDAKHNANIEFSNDGIKAAATTAVGGKGSLSCAFDYRYDVPVEIIDLTFDNPYMFFVRDKSSGEIWFTGTVYQPIEHKWYEYN